MSVCPLSFGTIYNEPVTIVVTHKWSAMLLDCPPPTTRLDHCCCIVKLSVPPVASDSEHLLATSQHAVEVLDTKLRLGSAGSMRSTASAGSMRSTASAGSERSHHSVGSGHDSKNGRKMINNKSLLHYPDMYTNSNKPIIGIAFVIFVFLINMYSLVYH